MTVGSPNMGFTEIPEGGCQKMNIDKGNKICSMERGLLRSLLFTDLLQNSISFASYFRPADNKGEYLEKSTFLPALNNEKPTDKSGQHKERITQLNGLMLVQFEQDQIIFPHESETFGEIVKEGDNNKLLNLRDTEWFKSDQLGLKTLDDKKKLHLVSINASHTEYSDKDLENTFIPFLKT